MSTAHIRPMTILVLAFLSLCTPIIAAPQAANYCNEDNVEKARDEFTSAMESYRIEEWSDAISHLRKAAALCPVPKKPIPTIWVSGFQGFEFIPFYYLGSSHYSLEERPDALRYFHLSSCFGESKRDKEVTEDLGDLTGQCLKQIVRQKRPEKQPSYFSDGVSAKGKDWEQSAERMWDSMQVWPEDGKTTIIAGRWPVPYVPRFHLANALFELGCRKQACEQLGRSKLKELAAKDTAGRYDEERKEMEQLEAKCTGAKNSGPENLWICQQWQCWLQRDRQTP